MKYLLPLIICLFICGCDSDTSNDKALSETGVGSVAIPRTINLSSQVVEVVKYDDTIPWLERNKNVYIDSIASINRAGHGYTNGYIIIYRKPNVTIVEKTAKELALDKLNDEDKAALGLK